MSRLPPLTPLGRLRRRRTVFAVGAAGSVTVSAIGVARDVTDRICLTVGADASVTASASDAAGDVTVSAPLAPLWTFGVGGVAAADMDDWAGEI